MKVFVSHGAKDTWIARQLARCINEIGIETFVDVYDIVAGDEFETRIKDGLASCDELVALFTPFSAKRAWVFMEIGAAWVQGKRVSAPLYGMTLKDFEGETGMGLLSSRHVLDLNDADRLLTQISGRK